MTNVQYQYGGIIPTGEKQKHLDKTLSQCRTDHKKISYRDWNELTVFAVQYERGK